MTETDMKKCLSVIRQKAVEVPKSTRQATSWEIPDEIANAIKEKIDEFGGEVAIPLGELNAQFGWKETSARTSYLTSKLNAKIEVNGKIVKVGTKNNKEYYVFSLVDIENKAEEEVEPED